MSSPHRSVQSGSMHIGWVAPVILTVCAFIMAGCLTAERKEYTITVKPDGSGNGKIIFYNLMSLAEDSLDVSLSDYGELINRYLKGDKFESENLAFINVKKRLFTENNQLNAEITFDFMTYEDVGLYRHQGKGPWMYYTNPSALGTEQFDTADGIYGGEKMPVVFWPEETVTFKIVNKYDNSAERPKTSLYSLYKRIGTE